MRGTFFWICVLAAAQFLVLSTAFAGLGENESSVDRDYLRFDGVQKTLTTFETYRVYTIITEGGLTVKEFVNSSAVVFAVTASGINQPDLTYLLGPYYSEYKGGKNHHRPPGHRHGSTQTEHITIEEGGHMRSLWTRAWISKLLPVGILDNEIQ